MNKTLGTSRTFKDRAEASVLFPTPEVSVLWADEFPGLEFAFFNGSYHAFPPHFHDAFEFVLVQEGAIYVEHRKTSHVAPLGSLLAFGPGEVQAGRPLERLPYISLCAFIEVPLVLELAREIDPYWTGPFGLPYSFLPSACVYCFEELCNSFLHAASALERESNLLLFISQLLPLTSEQPEETEPEAVTLVKNYLRGHLHVKVTLADLSVLTGLSKYYLLRTFKKTTGVSPHGFLTSLRVAAAKALLKDGVPVKEVARRSGFADSAHLTRLFKRYTGATPGLYRRGAAGSSGTFRQR